jgi:hypothetical protein|tara:strand:+ start:244 stop:900 length:657 start_codon:yes stop_codon:yes gene_type:complete
MSYPLQSASEMVYINLTLFTENDIKSFNKVTLITLIKMTNYGFGSDDNYDEYFIGDGPGGVPQEFYKDQRKTVFSHWTKPAPEKVILQYYLLHKRNLQTQKSIYYQIDAHNHSEYEHVAEELNELTEEYQELQNSNYNPCKSRHCKNINIENNILPNHIQHSLLINTELTCIVCLNDLDNDNVAITKCGHNYCRDCLGITLSLDKARQKCGQCRTEFR